MDEVSCGACQPIVDALADRGADLDALIEGLRVDVDHLRDPAKRIDWSAYCVFLERAAAALGGPEELEAVSNSFVHRGAGILRNISANFVSVRPIYRIGVRLYGPSVFRNTQATCEDLPDGRLRQTLEIDPAYQPSPLYFVLMRGSLRGAPRLLGQRDAVVEMKLETPRRAVYLITPPPARTLLARVVNWFKRGQFAADAVEDYQFQVKELGLSYERQKQISERLAAKSQQLETIHRLASELAQHMDVSTLADAVVERFEDQLGYSGVALWLEPVGGGPLELLRKSGDAASEPRSIRLHTADYDVGRLALWGEPAPGGAEVLEAVLPSLALALDKARSFQALTLQTRRLEQEIAERERAETQLQIAQKREAVGHLVSGMAHDFNNILTVVGGYTELARESVDAPETVDEYLGEIEAAVERCSGLITHLLVFSRGQLQNPQVVDWNDLLAGMERMLRLLAGESIELVLVPGEGLGLVRADPGQLEQVVVNLVLNSRDAMPSGGRIVIETRNAEFEAGSPGREGLKGPCVRLQVRDSGIGMDAETRERIFEPFFTTKTSKGTGLGLSTLLAIVRRAGGALGVESEVGHGTTISVDLPRVAGVPDDLERGTTYSQIPCGDETILLVDDEDQVRAVTRAILEYRGYRVLSARHGEEALEICRQHEGPIAALLTDMVMPGIDGRELAEQVRKLRPELRGTIFLSGYARGETQRRLPADSAFLRKPYTLSGLLRTVRRFLDD